MTEQLIAIAIGAIILTVCFVRGLPIGVFMLAAASIVGVTLAGLPLAGVFDGFPVSLLVLLLGLTFFFGLAQVNGTIDLLIERVLDRVGDRTALLPLAFFAITGLAASMGNPFSSVVVFPIGMNVAKQRGIDPMLMGISIAGGVSAGAFAPTSLFGIVTYGTARSADIALNPALLFAIVLVVNLVLVAVAYAMFGRRGGSWTWNTISSNDGGTGGIDADPTPLGGTGGTVATKTPPRVATSPSTATPKIRDPFTPMQRFTVASIISLIVTVFASTLLDLNFDLGVIGLVFGGMVCLVDPDLGKRGLKTIDWSTILLVTGIITYVGVLKELGAIDMIGAQAAKLSTPLIAAFAICLAAAIISAFASTTAMLAALVPLALPVINSGGVPGWALIAAIGLCASLVDVSPFSTLGALLITTTPDEKDRPRLTRLLMRWGMSMIVIGPVLLVGGLVVPAMVL